MAGQQRNGSVAAAAAAAVLTTTTQKVRWQRRRKRARTRAARRRVSDETRLGTQCRNREASLWRTLDRVRSCQGWAGWRRR
eukprot:scaffold47172_cov68-Phaeocystis_antarctica.AAC.1